MVNDYVCVAVMIYFVKIDSSQTLKKLNKQNKIKYWLSGNY